MSAPWSNLASSGLIRGVKKVKLSESSGVGMNIINKVREHTSAENRLQFLLHRVRYLQECKNIWPETKFPYIGVREINGSKIQPKSKILEGSTIIVWKQVVTIKMPQLLSANPLDKEIKLEFSDKHKNFID